MTSVASGASSSSEVTLISNPTPSFAVFQWVPHGLRRLNRKNKLSSLPFWFPNSTMRRHQFRLVLLRGVVREDTEQDDAIAVFLEYIPPPSDSSGTNSVASASAPKGTKVTIRLLHQSGIQEGDRTRDIVEEHAAVMDDAERQIGFREFISAKTLHNSDYVLCNGDDKDGSGSHAVLEISILVGVNVVTQATTEVVGSLWSAVSSWGASVQSLVQKTVQAVQEHREEFEAVLLKREPETGSTTAPPQSRRELPWDDVPERWKSREASWRHFVCDVLVEDENTFLIGSSRGMTSDEQMLLTQYGVNHRAVSCTEGLFDFDRDVHEGLLSLKSLRAQRYRLVPSRVKDETFWGNFMWKVYSIATCTTDDQAKLLLSVINAPPQPSAAGTSASETAGDHNSTGGVFGHAVASNVHSFLQFAAASVANFGQPKPVDAEEVAQAIQSALEAVSALREIQADATASGGVADADDLHFLDTAVRGCENSVAQLDRLVKRGGDEALLESLRSTMSVVAHALEAYHASAKEHVASSATNPEEVPAAEAPITTEAKNSAWDDEETFDHHSEEPPVDDAAVVVAEEGEAEEEKVTLPMRHDEVGNAHSERLEALPLTSHSEDEREEAVSEARRDEDGHPEPAADAVGEVEETTEGAATVDAERSPVMDSAPVSVEDDAVNGSPFEPLPSIDDMETPDQGIPQAHHDISSSAKKQLEFAPMPWEEEDD
eukprot:CAMPEP_0176450158 /NCGR_PEP_ID=MMETSP0127-20121128/26964_1 /TAXON_ID=938130 /ORGANISM="Platyophrya macrostoma, Strain WH" /LENGTH=715 /DNA_ID=CAMNT_0017837749 /DNA_START=97 /DNA_END=2244 /DNA_ORIENTATION=+